MTAVQSVRWAPDSPRFVGGWLLVWIERQFGCARDFPLTFRFAHPEGWVSVGDYEPTCRESDFYEELDNFVVVVGERLHKRPVSTWASILGPGWWAVARSFDYGVDEGCRDIFDDAPGRDALPMLPGQLTIPFGQKSLHRRLRDPRPWVDAAADDV